MIKKKHFSSEKFSNYLYLKLFCCFCLSFSINYSIAQCIEGNCKNGEGTYQFQSKAKYTGTFANGEMKKGIYFYSNKDYYKGEFKDNKRHGRGNYQYHSGNQYIGIYDLGKKVRGTFIYSDGSKYVGNFRNEKRHGRGILTTKNGKSYDGFWRKNEYIGRDSNNPIVTYVVIVGVADYLNSGRLGLKDLSFTINDARNFKSFIEKRTMGGDNWEINFLTNQKASKKNILAVLRKQFSKADENDRVIFYFSGHGDKRTFIPYDCIPNEPKTYLFHKEVTNEFKRSKSRNKLLIADACYAGTLKKGNSKSKNFEKEITKVYQEINVAVLLSSSAKEVSYEDSTLQQGIFSFFLIKGWNGIADINKDKIVTIEELYNYVRNNTYHYVKKNMNKIQRPTLFGKFDKNMPVSIVE